MAESQLRTLDDSTETTTIRTTTKASFLEIYNERVYDLLSFSDLEEALPVREDSAKGVYVEGLSERIVHNTLEAMDVLRCGMENRKVASTNMNRVSSRSHAMFVLTVRSEITEGGITKVRQSKFTLVDLAGSERQKNTDTAGERLKEASMINNSLLCLGQVINSLVESQRGMQKHAPFRNTKLTFLLRDSFGGNSKTALVATVTPSLASLTETISTLQFAQRAKLIKNVAVLNEDTCGSVAALQAEIARLKSELQRKTNSQSGPFEPREFRKSEGSPDDSATIIALRHQNSKLSKAIQVLKETTNLRDTQVNSLKRKLQQETLIRKCKERRITYFSNKTLSSESVQSQEIAALQEEVSTLRDQIESTRNFEAIDWMLRYKEAKAKVEELQGEGTNSQIPNQDELESTLVSLLNEKDALQAKLETLQSNQNGELDAILADVTKLENDNRELQTALDEKKRQVLQQEEKIRINEVQCGEIKVEVEKTIECLGATQADLSAERAKSCQLQESLEDMKKEIDEKTVIIEDYKGKVSSTEEEIMLLHETHAALTTSLQSRILELQENVRVVMNDNNSLTNKMKEATNEIARKQAQLKALELEKEEATKKLNIYAQREVAYLEAFKLKESEFLAESKELKKSLLHEKSNSLDRLKKVSTENSALLDMLESFKVRNALLQEQLASSDILRDIVAELEEELSLVAAERDFIQSDLDRTLRFHHEFTDATAVCHERDLKLRDELINSLKQENSAIRQELDAATFLLSQSEKRKIELAVALDKVSELESLIQRLTKDALSLKAEVASGDKAKCDLLEFKMEEEQLESEYYDLKCNEISSNEEVVYLKAKLASLEKEFQSLRKQSADKFEVDNIKSLSGGLGVKNESHGHDDDPVNTTFGADDSFDESMFLPNVQAEERNENQTPSKTPFKERRALFSPTKTPLTSKTPAGKVNHLKRNERTPLGVRNI